MVSKSVLVRSPTYSNSLLGTSRQTLTGLIGQSARSMTSQPRAFILDFDGTITEKDTIGVLGTYGIEWQGKKGVDMKGVWREVVAAYRRDFDHHVGKYKPMKQDRRTLEEEVRYLRGLREIEERSFGRVSDLGVFKGMGRRVWEDIGRKAVEKGDVIVRKGFREFVEKVKEQGDRWGIVSVNFSGSFIRGVVGASARPQGDVEILANNPDDDGILVGPNSESKKVIATSDAKLATTKDLLNSWSDGAQIDTSRTVYIGDSGTDIESFMEPGVTGIIMAKDGQGSLMATMKRIDIDVVHIGVFEEEQSRPRGDRKYWTRDFEEIIQSPLFSLR